MRVRVWGLERLSPGRGRRVRVKQGMGVGVGVRVGLGVGEGVAANVAVTVTAAGHVDVRDVCGEDARFESLAAGGGLAEAQEEVAALWVCVCPMREQNIRERERGTARAVRAGRTYAPSRRGRRRPICGAGKGKGGRGQCQRRAGSEQREEPRAGTHTTAIEARSFSKNCDIVHTSIKTAGWMESSACCWLSAADHTH